MAKHTQEFLDSVWEKGRKVKGHSPNTWRKDQCGAWIKKSDHGDRDSQFGWEVDRITAGGAYSLTNCRPLQWENNVSKGNGRLKCSITARPYRDKHLNKEI